MAEFKVPCAVCFSTLKDSWQGVLTEKVNKKPIISIYSVIKKACFLIFEFVYFFLTSYIKQWSCILGTFNMLMHLLLLRLQIFFSIQKTQEYIYKYVGPAFA